MLFPFLWCVVEYPAKCDVEVDIPGVILCLVENYGWHELFQIGSKFSLVCCKPNKLSNSLLINISNCCESPQVFQRGTFQWREEKIEVLE